MMWKLLRTNRTTVIARCASIQSKAIPYVPYVPYVCTPNTVFDVFGEHARGTCPNTSNTVWHRLSAKTMCELVKRTFLSEIRCHHSHTNRGAMYRKMKCCRHRTEFTWSDFFFQTQPASSGYPPLLQREPWTDLSFVLSRTKVTYAGLGPDTVPSLFE